MSMLKKFVLWHKKGKTIRNWKELPFTSSAGVPDYLGTLIELTSVSSIVKYGVGELDEVSTCRNFRQVRVTNLTQGEGLEKAESVKALHFHKKALRQGD